MRRACCSGRCRELSSLFVCAHKVLKRDTYHEEGAVCTFCLKAGRLLMKFLRSKLLKTAALCAYERRMVSAGAFIVDAAGMRVFEFVADWTRSQSICGTSRVKKRLHAPIRLCGRTRIHGASRFDASVAKISRPTNCLRFALCAKFEPHATLLRLTCLARGSPDSCSTKGICHLRLSFNIRPNSTVAIRCHCSD